MLLKTSVVICFALLSISTLKAQNYVQIKKEADALIVEGLYKEAVAVYTKAIELNPSDYLLYSLRGAVYLSKMYDDHRAMKDYEKAVKLNPEYAAGYKSIGKIHFNNSEQKKACKWWKKARDLKNKEAGKLIKKYCK